jgi:hypothetical protein
VAKLKLFSAEEERYLFNQILSGNEKVTQKALHWLSDRLSEECRFADPLHVRNSLRICLTSESMGVRRWALNAIAILGLGHGSDYSIIIDQLHPAENDPDLMAAVVAALYALHPANASQLLSAKGVDLTGANLIAAAQYSPAQLRVLIDTKIPIDSSSSEELKAGLILTGTAKAPEHLFFAAHKNKVALEQLNLHPVSSVSKYSIWALAKLKLGFDSLKIPLSDFDSSPPEVRKWVLRLLFSDPKNLAKNLEMVQRAGRDESEEVRHEGAIELRSAYVKDLGSYVMDWYFNESFIPAKDALIEHMAAQAYKSGAYMELVTRIYEIEPAKSQRRTRLEAAAAGTSSYGEFRRIAIKAETTSLFQDAALPRENPVTNNYNFGDNSNFGAISIGGDVNNQTIQAVGSVQNPAIREVLESVLAFINGSELNPDQKAEGEQLVREAATEPNKTKMQKLIVYVKAIGTGASAVGTLVGGVDGLVEKIQSVLS